MGESREVGVSVALGELDVSFEILGGGGWSFLAFDGDSIKITGAFFIGGRREIQFFVFWNLVFSSFLFELS